jgi:hypothetical protein
MKRWNAFWIALPLTLFSIWLIVPADLWLGVPF